VSSHLDVAATTESRGNTQTDETHLRPGDGMQGRPTTVNRECRRLPEMTDPDVEGVAIATWTKPGGSARTGSGSQQPRAGS
jgi:hypothetical protein